MKLETKILKLARKYGLQPFQVEEILVRGMIVPEPRPGKLLAMADVNAIEARMAAWLAGDPNVDLFRANVDVYCNFASKLFGHAVNKKNHPEKRSTGKVAELSAQYGVGGPKLSLMATKQGVDFASLGLTGWDVVHAWRDQHPRMAGTWDGTSEYKGLRVYRGGWWREMHEAAKKVIASRRPQSVGVLVFEMVGDDMHVTIPDSPVRLVYREPAMEMVERDFDGEIVERNEWRYTKSVTKGNVQRVSMYPGKWAENVTQHTCWVILNSILVDMNEAGYNAVLDVHDEVLIEEDEDKAEKTLTALVDRMILPPSWAPDLPLKAEGFVAPYYTKEARNDWFQYEQRQPR